MAYSYLTKAQKIAIGNVMDCIHETFKREITLFRVGQRVSIAANPDYNAFYGSQQTPELETTSLTTDARIRYVKAEEELLIRKDGSTLSGNQDKIVLPAGSVKIKVNQEAYEFLKNAQRVELDGNRFAVVSNARLIAMFGPTISPYYEFLLTPTDE